MLLCFVFVFVCVRTVLMCQNWYYNCTCLLSKGMCAYGERKKWGCGVGRGGGGGIGHQNGVGTERESFCYCFLFVVVCLLLLLLLFLGGD